MMSLIRRENRRLNGHQQQHFLSGTLSLRDGSSEGASAVRGRVSPEELIGGRGPDGGVVLSPDAPFRPQKLFQFQAPWLWRGATTSEPLT